MTQPLQQTHDENKPFVQFAALIGYVLSDVFNTHSNLIDLSSSKEKKHITTKAFIDDSLASLEKSLGLIDDPADYQEYFYPMLQRQLGDALATLTELQNSFKLFHLDDEDEDLSESEVELNILHMQSMKENIEAATIVLGQGSEQTPTWHLDDIQPIAVMPYYVLPVISDKIDAAIEKETDFNTQSKMRVLHSTLQSIEELANFDSVDDDEDQTYANTVQRMRDMRTKLNMCLRVHSDILEEAFPLEKTQLSALSSVLDDFLTKVFPPQGGNDAVVSLDQIRAARKAAELKPRQP